MQEAQKKGMRTRLAKAVASSPGLFRVQEVQKKGLGMRLAKADAHPRGSLTSGPRWAGNTNAPPPSNTPLEEACSACSKHKTP